MTETIKIVRPDIVAQLVERDGARCTHPECKHPELDLSITEGPFMATIDHTEPQSWCYDQGWTREQVWDLSNLTLMHRKCNADKGDRRYREDGTLPPKPQSRFRYRRDKRASRPDLCLQCNNGHDLMVGEVCASCGCNAQRFPRSAHVPFPECDHELFWCWVCSITPDMRPSSVGIAMRQADSDELGEVFLDSTDEDAVE